MKLLEKHFEIALETPNGITRLRELILKLAMQGKLVEQNFNDKPAKELINDIVEAKQKFVVQKKIKSTSTLLTEDEVLFKLPNNWIWCRLEQISEYIQRGKGPVYSEIEEIPVISQKCVQWNGFNKNVVKFISPDSISKYQPERFIRKGDLLWNSTGTGTLGRINCYNDELKEFPIVVADSHVTVVRPLIVNSSYILYFLKSPYVQETIEANASGTTNQIELNTSTIKNQVIPLPPLEEQKRIVEKIDQLMLLCDKLEAERDRKNKLQLQINSAAINNLVNANDDVSINEAWSFILNNFNTLYSVVQNISELKDAILNLAIRGRIINDLKNVVVDVHPSKKFPLNKDDQPFSLPMGWKWIALKDLGVTQTGTTPPTKNPEYYGSYMPFIGPGDIKNHKIDYTNISLSELGVEKARVIRKDSIMMVCIGGSIGKMATNDRNVACNQQINTITPHSNIDLKYLYAVLRSSYFQNQVLSKASGSATPIINKQKWISILVPVPPYEIQKRISSKINYLFALCDKLEDMNNQSSKKQEQILNAVLAKI